MNTWYPHTQSRGRLGLLLSRGSLGLGKSFVHGQPQTLVSVQQCCGLLGTVVKGGDGEQWR